MIRFYNKIPDGEDGRGWVGQVLQQVATISIPHFHMKSLLKATTEAPGASDGQALGTIHILRKHFLGFLTPTPVRKHSFSTEDKEKNDILYPPPLQVLT